ncbi:NAD(P)-dependent alcohol dehydrogenase [Pasteurellaceae bacterium LIM206]|nr:NAD(P)-dependent alcohol dehydrogenase [Pasteurellaceae bacterium LIM206]
MAIQSKGFAAPNATSPLAFHSFERRDLRADDVEISIEYCGVCHSDLHMARNDWGMSIYPLVPGHEIIGRVKAIGKDVTKFKVGDLVGVGCMVDSCQHCEPCRHHLEQYCNGMIATYSAIDPKDGMITYGGYSDKIIVTEKFVLHVPENLDTKAVAPVLCAGITTWSPLRHWNVGKDSKVAVIGLGGLGHMALKLANALGAEVTLFTRSLAKAEDAKRLGAHNIVLSTDEAQMKAAVNQFDLIIDTVPYDHDLNPYMPTLKIDGTLVLVGLIGDISNTLSTVPMVMGRRAIAGSMIGGIKETQELLDFCGEHNITADVEMIDMENINEAYQRMLKSDVKYRFVIDVKKWVNKA